MSEIKHYPLPWEFIDEPDGTTDMILQYEGCPILTVRGVDDMSCIDNDEDEERAINECKSNALFVFEACNNYDKLKEQNEKLKEAIQHFIDRVDKGEVRSVRSYNRFKEALKSCES